MHLYENTGTYNAILTVNDSKGYISVYNSIYITVSESQIQVSVYDIPEPPVLITTSPQTIIYDNITIVWNDAEGSTSYNIYVDGILNETTSDISQKIILWVNGTYEITVTSVNGSGESDPSTAITIIVDIPPVTEGDGAIPGYSPTILVLMLVSYAIIYTWFVKKKKPKNNSI